jgi:hypothetical protein
MKQDGPSPAVHALQVLVGSFAFGEECQPQTGKM